MKKKVILITSISVVVLAAVIIGMLLLFVDRAKPGYEGYIVGKDFPTEEVFEFYWTYETTTDPAEYQSYRFARGEEAGFFEQEHREGEWPTTTDDMTEYGYIDLTEKEWQEFLKLIEGGQAIPPRDHDETGNPGPWIYLYRNKHEGDGILEYHFSSKQESAFEEYCKELAKRTR